MRLWADEYVYVFAWDRPWEDRVDVLTDFYHLIPTEDLRGIRALAPTDSGVYTRLEGVNPGRCSPDRLREHETPRL